MKLSILIPTTPDRERYMLNLRNQFNKQLNYHGSFTPTGKEIITTSVYDDVEVIEFKDNFEHSIGYKRNRLLDLATGEYVAFIDSDDRISDDYFKLVMEGIDFGVDCCSLRGIITENGKNPLIFEHSIKYNAYKTNPDVHPIRYERYPNHLNCIKSDIAKLFRFPLTNHGEDTDFATQVHKSGLLKTEHWIDSVIYYYDYRTK